MDLLFPYRPNPSSCRAIPLFLIFFILFSYQGRTAAQTMDQVLTDRPDEPWHISADTLKYESESSVYMGRGHVEITKGDKRLSADQVRFDRTQMTARAEGNVVLRVGGDRLSGRRLDLDLRNETGTLYDGSLFVKESNLTIAGDKIEKTGKATYSAKRARLTTCNADVPDWKITARDLELTIEGYGSAWHAAFWAKKVPVLYTPYLSFPVKLRRQTGFLSPRFGSSNRKGLEVEDPFFWAINDSADATFYYHYLENRGNKLGLEYRQVFGENSKTTAMFDWLDDAKVDDGTRDNKKWGYGDDANPRPNHERYWFRMKHDQELPAGFLSQLDLDIVSDQDYLPEFRDGFSGFNASRKQFLTTFGRDLDDYNDITRVNRLNLARTWNAFSLNGQGRWTDHVVNRNLDRPDTTVQRLPSVDFNGSKQRIGQSPFYYTFNSQYAYLYRQDGSEVKNETGTHRGDIYPRAYLPFDLKNYLNIEPSLGVRETAWYVDRYEDPPEDEKETFNRHMADARLDLSNELYRVYSAHLGPIERIKHTLQPKVTYEYVPEQDQEDLPNFDATDRIAEKSLITYSLTNTFTYRAKTPRPSTAPDSEPPQTDVTYHQFARLKLEQKYDLLTTVDQPAVASTESDQPALEKGDKPFSAIRAELEILPKNYFAFKADTDWSVAHNRFDASNLSLTLWDERGDRLFGEYRYNREASTTNDKGKTVIKRLQSILMKGEIPLTPRITLYGRWERDLDENTDLEYGGGFKYAAQCWAVDLAHSVEEDDHRYYFILDLYGLGKFGN
jgi:LPS-assembly protein